MGLSPSQAFMREMFHQGRLILADGKMMILSRQIEHGETINGFTPKSVHNSHDATETDQ